MNNTYVKFSNGKGRGVFTSIPLKKGDIIDMNYSIDIDSSYVKKIDETPIKDYYFEFPDGTVKLVLGNISLINHSLIPNIKKVWNYDNDLGHMISVFALVDLDQDVELFHNYEFDQDKMPDWT